MVSCDCASVDSVGDFVYGDLVLTPEQVKEKLTYSCIAEIVQKHLNLAKIAFFCSILTQNLYYLDQ